MFPITINKGERCFTKNKVVFNLVNDLAVITGINGCGKTNFLKCIAEQFNQKIAGSAFFKTTIQSSTTLFNKRIITPYGPAFLEDNEITTVSDIIGKISARYIKFNKSTYTTKHDFLRCLFDEESSEFVKYRESFLRKEVFKVMSEEFGNIEEELRHKFGLPTEDAIKKELIKTVKSDTKTQNGFKRITKDRKDEINSTVESIILNKTDIYNEAYENVKKGIKNYDIDTIEKFETYIYQLISPFKTVEGIISKLSSIIAEDARINSTKKGVGSKIWQKINHILEGKRPDGGDILINQKRDFDFEKSIQDMFRYKLKQPSKYNASYELLFCDKSEDYSKRLVHFDELSSGEKIIFELICYVYIFGYDEALKPAILLLDEFDANLNPALANVYLKIVKEFLIKEAKLKVILTTHSPSTIAEVEPEFLWEMYNEENQDIRQAKSEDGKGRILEKLAPRFVYDEELGPIGAIKGSKNVIIFVEGKDDEKYFSEEAKKRELNNYKFIDCESATKIPFALKSFSNIPYFKKILKTKTVIGLFDFDAEGIDVIENQIFSGNDQKNKTKENIQLFTNKKEPIIFNYYSGIYVLTLIPPKEHDAWTNFRSKNSRYRIEELKEDERVNGGAVERLFTHIKNIVESNNL